MHGTADVNVAISHSETLAKQIPGAQLEVVEGADHMMPFSHANVVDTAVKEFIQQVHSDRAETVQ